MKTVGQKLDAFRVTGVKPGFNHHEENGVSAFEDITQDSFRGKWKVIYFYPKDFTFVCPTEIVGFAKLGVRDVQAGVPLRATFIVDPDNVIQHVSVNNLNVGRSPEEVLRVLDGLQTDELCPCNRAVGAATLTTPAAGATLN